MLGTTFTVVVRAAVAPPPVGSGQGDEMEFARLWARHAVRQCRSDVRDFQHPLVGRLVLNEEVMELSQDEGQRLVIFSAEPDSPSEAGLRLLTGLTATLEQNRAPSMQCA